jgi:hypothetical protein
VDLAVGGRLYREDMVRTADDDRTGAREGVRSTAERRGETTDDDTPEPDCSCRRCRDVARDEMWIRWA